MKQLSELVQFAESTGEGLPVNPADGDIPCFDATSTEGAGNDDTTKFLLQPVAGSAEIEDTAAGNPAPVPVTNTGNVIVDTEGALYFTGNNYLSIAANTLPEDTLGKDMEWTMDIVYKANAKDRQCLFGRGDSPRMDFLLDSNGTLSIGGGPDLGTGWGFGVWQHLTFEVYKDGSTWRYAVYRNGSLVVTGTWGTENWRGAELWIGYEGYTSSRMMSGQIKAFRLTNKALHKGQSFTPDELPWTTPKQVGTWGTINKANLVQAPAPIEDGDIPCYSATATTGGGIDDATHLMLHFDEESGIPADSSQDEILITANDTAANAATAKFDKARNLNNSYLSLTCPAMATGSGDFTYDGWFYFNKLNTRRGLFGVDMGLYVALWGDNTFGAGISTNGSSWTYNHLDYDRSEAIATLNVWQHIALVRHGATVTLYLQGNAILSFDIGADTVITGNMGNNPFRIGYPLGGMSYVADFCDEFRFSTGARWTGNFTPPDAPYSKQVIEGKWDKINKSDLVLKDNPGLIPEGAKDGDILGYQEGVDRGNNVNTKLLLQPATSDGLINDQAAGNAAPVSITNSGTVTVVDNTLVFTGENSLVIQPNTLDMVLGGNNEYTIEIDFQLDSVKSDYATLFGADGGASARRGALYFTSGGAASFTDGLGPVTSGWSLGTRHRITVERWNDNGSWKLSVYRNGALLSSKTTNVNVLSDYAFPIGSNIDSTSRNFIGKIYVFKISDKAEHRGVSFTPLELPLLPPAGQPVWTEGIDRSRLLPENPVNGDIPCYNATATIGGGNDENTKALIHFDTAIKDEAAGNASPLALTTLNATIDTSVKKFGEGALKLTGGHVFVPVEDLTDVNFIASCWAYFDTVPSSYAPLFSQDDDTSGSWSLAIQSGGTYMFCRGGASKAVQPLQAQAWHYFAVVKQNKEVRFYLDGAYIYSLTDSILKFTAPIIGIGEQSNEDGRRLTGYVDEFRLQILPANEIDAWTGLTIPIPDAPYTKAQEVGEWGKFNKANIPVLEAEPVDGNLMVYTTQTFNVSDTMHLLHFDDPDQWFKDETGNYTGDATRRYYAFSTDIKKFGNGGLQYQSPNGTADYKAKVFNISGVYPLKGPQDAVTVELWFYVDQSCIFEIPSIMAKKGTSSSNWNFWLTHKTIYVDDVAVAVDDVARLSYHNFDTVSLYDEVEVPYSRPTIEAGWHHFAFCRDAAYNHYMFLDGTMLIKVLGSQFGSSQYLCPIVPDATSSRIDCTLMFDTQVLNYYDELRYSSVCLYTKNFVPPSEPFTYDAGAANKDVTGWFPASPGVIGLITGVNNWIPSASGQLTIPEASESFPGLMSATDKQNLSSEWYTLTAAADIVLSRSNGALQKVTLTQNCTLTAPVLTTEKPTLLLQVTSSSAVTVTVGSTNIVTAHTGTFQVGWFWDGEATRRYPVVEIG